MEQDIITNGTKEIFDLLGIGEKCDKMVVTEWTTKRNGEGIRP